MHTLGPLYDIGRIHVTLYREIRMLRRPKGTVIKVIIQTNFIPGSKSAHVSARSLPDPLASSSKIPTEIRASIESIILSRYSGDPF